MTIERQKIVAALAAAFGEAAINMISDSHIRIESVGLGWHDLYFADNGDMALRLKGKRGAAEVVSAKDIISRITIYQETKVGLAEIHEALKLGECIQHAYRVLIDRRLEAAIFVDGGWRDGRAKIAAILVRDSGDSDICVRTVECQSSAIAEVRAVLLGYELRKDDDMDIPIFTDCQTVLGHTMVSHVGNIHWVPRIRNKGADHLSNMRRKHMVAFID